MQPTGNYSGPCRHLTVDRSGYVRLTNAYLGDARPLDTDSSTWHQAFMCQTGNYGTQLWRLRAGRRGFRPRRRRLPARATVCIYGVRYEWDEAKNVRNREIHDGISLELASLAMEDAFCLIVPDRIDSRTGERRWHAIGEIRSGESAAILLVVHAYREDRDGEEIIRIISARAAEKHEIRRYREQAVD